MVGIDDIRPFALALPRAYEALVRDRVKFRVGRIVFVAFSRDETMMGVGFPKEERAALVAAEPDTFVMPRPSDLRYQWIETRLAALDLDEAHELVLDAWRMCVPKSVGAQIADVASVRDSIGFGTLRDFVAADQPEVRRLVLDGLRERWGAAFDARHNPDLDDIAATYLDQGAEVVVVVVDGLIVATGTLLVEGERSGRLVRVSVESAARRRGHGRRVVDELVTRARRRAMTEVVVTADTPWTSAVALYRDCGFVEVAADHRSTRFRLRLDVG